MRVVLQKVIEASVTVDCHKIANINKGLLVLVGFLDTDNEETFKYIIDKIINLRIFEDNENKMNLSLKNMNGELLIVPNFTLYGDCRKGRRPSYSNAANVDKARIIFKEFIEYSEETYKKIAYGQFQADMKVSLINDGPVTLLIDSEKKF